MLLEAFLKRPVGPSHNASTGLRFDKSGCRDNRATKAAIKSRFANFISHPPVVNDEGTKRRFDALPSLAAVGEYHLRPGSQTFVESEVPEVEYQYVMSSGMFQQDRPRSWDDLPEEEKAVSYSFPFLSPQDIVARDPGFLKFCSVSRHVLLCE